MNPLLSVIIASYNHGYYIAESLKSIECQSFQDFEIIVVDDGSTDNTIDIIRIAQTRAQIYTQSNQGVVAARNRGLSLARGKYICFIDSDDIILPDRFLKQVTFLENNPTIGMLYSDALAIDTEGNHLGKFSDIYPVVPGNIAEMLVMHYCFVPIMTVMVRRHVLDQLGAFEEPGHLSDYMKWIEVAECFNVHYDPEPLGCWRRHAVNTSKLMTPEKTYAETRIALARILKKHPNLAQRLGNRVRQRFARSYFLTAFFFAASGNIEKAREYYKIARSEYPWSLFNWTGWLLSWCPVKSFTIWVHSYVKCKKLPW